MSGIGSCSSLRKLAETKILGEGNTAVEGKDNKVNSPTIINIFNSGNDNGIGNVSNSGNCVGSSNCTGKGGLNLGLALAGQLLSNLGGMFGLGDNSTNSEQSELLDLIGKNRYAMNFLC